MLVGMMGGKWKLRIIYMLAFYLFIGNIHKFFQKLNTICPKGEKVQELWLRQCMNGLKNMRLNKYFLNDYWHMVLALCNKEYKEKIGGCKVGA